jgi:BTB/POZ domain
VGESLEPFDLPIALVVDRSPFLKSPMTGQMKEAQEKTAKLPNLDPSTFGRFAEYIYCGNYNAPVPVRTDIQKAGIQAVDDTA